MRTFFDEANRLERLSVLGDKLEVIKAGVDFEFFRPLLGIIWKSEDNRPGGRQRWDRVLIFKILVLQKLYNIADDATEYQINDRLSFQRFLGLELGDNVPDAKTIWKYKEDLAKSGKSKELFKLYNGVLEEVGIITREGSIIDATIIQRPQQRYNKKKKQYEKNGETMPEETNPHKKSQIDTDATYTSKNGKCYFGYKNHIKADVKSKIILDYEITTASTSDGTQAPVLVDEKDEVLFGDSAYGNPARESAIQASIKEKSDDPDKEITLMICEKAQRGKPLTDEQRANNTVKAKIRCRIEHIFGHKVKSMGGKNVRQAGFTRNACALGLKNLAYNFSRAAFLLKQRVESILLPKTARSSG